MLTAWHSSFFFFSLDNIFEISGVEFQHSIHQSHIYKTFFVQSVQCVIMFNSFMPFFFFFSNIPTFLFYIFPPFQCFEFHWYFLYNLNAFISRIYYCLFCHKTKTILIKWIIYNFMKCTIMLYAHVILVWVHEHSLFPDSTFCNCSNMKISCSLKLPFFFFLRKVYIWSYFVTKP